MSGHLEHEVIIAAFSKLIGSAGRDSFFHLAFNASVVRILRGSISGVIGIFLFIISGNHIVSHNSLLSLYENAPIYDTKADANRASPITLFIFSPNVITFSLHLLFSPDSPLTKLSAAFNLFSHY